MNKDRFVILDYETTGIEDYDVPIEIGLMVTDENFNELDRFECLIRCKLIKNLTPDYWAKAEKFHNIPQKEVWDEGRHPEYVAQKLVDLAKQWKPQDGRIILMSDNIQFEWRHTKWVLDSLSLKVQDVFHYCGWDTSSLTLFTDFKDPEDTAHRAMSDVEGLVKELRRIKDVD